MAENNDEHAADRSGTNGGDDAVRRRAYDRYLARGGEPGHDVDDWLAAEQETREGRGDATAAPEPPAAYRATEDAGTRIEDDRSPHDPRGARATPRAGSPRRR